MSKENITIGSSELEIMKILWESDVPISSQVINKAVEEKNWKRTTVATFLSRLVQKGAIACEKKGSSYYYFPLISAKDYKKAQAKNLIKSLFNNSVTDFAAALFEENDLTEEDIRQLKSIFDGRG